MSIDFGSVCSGVEAASEAWVPLGWRPRFVSEIEPFCCSLLKQKHPEIKNYGDFTTIGPDAGPIDVLVGGTPCQDFSVAGLRAGLDGARGNLTIEFVKLTGRLRPRWVVWENVPGVLSIDGGRAFGAFLGGLAELGYGFAYRVLDAQHFGVPQRRRRVFVVGYFGDWRPAAAVLFERHSLSGDSAPRREAGQRVAGTISARTEGGGGLGTDFDLGGGLVPETSFCLNAKGGGGRIDGESETFITHSLRADGFDASEDGTGRGTPLVPVPILEAGARTGKSTDDPRAGIGIGEPGDPMYTLQSGKQHAIAFDTTQMTSAANYSNPKPGDPCHPLASGAHPPAVAFTERGREQGRTFECQEEVAYCLTNPGSGGRTHSRQLMTPAMAVRRLTPRECERLQGFSDDYTLITHRGKPAADGSRYKALGNSMAVPVMKWIGERIQLVDTLLRPDQTQPPQSEPTVRPLALGSDGLVHERREI